MTRLSTMLHCAYFPLCSGCEWQGDVSYPPLVDGLRKYFKSLHPELHFPLNVDAITGWRHRSKLAVRGTDHNPEIGLYKSHSHDVVAIPDCPLHHPSINAAYQVVQKAMVKWKIAPYREEKGEGVLRYIQFVVERKTGRVQLTLVINRREPSLENFVKQLYSEGNLHSVWLNLQSRQTNTIFGEEWILCEGERYLWEKLGNSECAFHPACFGQAHLPLFDKALHTLRDWVMPNSNILELYAGMGGIGFNLIEKSRHITCVEINPFAQECFEQTHARLSEHAQSKISMYIASSEKAVAHLKEKEVIIVDPPRKGIEASVLEAICKTSNAQQLIYLSCGPESFQRDCEKLIAHGWHVEKAEGFLFFPGKNHVEILCKLKKR